MHIRIVLAAIVAAASVGNAPLAFAQSASPLDVLSDRVSIPVDEARVFSVPKDVATVVIGNPSITDVTFTQDRRGAILTGKSFGSTNILLLSRSGDRVANAIVSVVRSPDSVTVTHGDKRATFSCAPRCAPTQTIGDSPEVTGQISAQIQERTNAASNASAAAAAR